MIDTPSSLSYFSAPSGLFSLAFAFFLSAALMLKLWLASRQMRHIWTHRHEVPAAFANSVSLSSHQKAADYTTAKLRFGLINEAFSTIVLLAWTLLGGLEALNQGLLHQFQTQGSPGLASPMAYQLSLLAAFMLINAALELPFSWYSTFYIEQKFGFNRMSTALFMRDLLLSTVVSAVIGLPLAAAVLWFMGQTGAFWWLYAWAFWLSFQMLMVLIYPTWIQPLFNKFTPLEDQALKTQIEALMQQCGFKAKGLFVMDGSKRSAHANAYFTGFGSSKRVVFFDTLLSKLTASELMAVLAHELGHFKHKHIVKRMVWMFAFSLLALAVLGLLSQQAWFYTGLGVIPNFMVPNDALALLLFMLAMPAFTFVLKPLLAASSRAHEFEADAYAMQHASGKDLRQALLKLFEDNASTLTPDPLYVRFYYSHPPASERLARMPA